MEKNVLIVHFNTPEVTRATVLSVLKHTPDCKITIFDNSDRKPFVPMNGVRIIDNTKGQEIDFEKMLARYPNRIPNKDNFASAKHCYSIDYCFRYFRDGFVLLDSDVLVKNDISDLFDYGVVWVGMPHKTKKHEVNIPRLYPFCCFINTRLCRENGIHYFDGAYMWKLTDDHIRSWYDTGAWFLRATRQLPCRAIKIYDYIIHYGSASFRQLRPYTAVEWIKMNAHLWNNMEEIDIKDKVLVVIPYFAKAAQGREIEYAVAGWRRYFKEPYHIVVVGDYNPVVDTGDDISFIKCPRVAKPPLGNYRPHIDHVHKFREVRKHYPESKGFVYTCDDIYAFKDFTMQDILKPKVKRLNIWGTLEHKNAWVRDNVRTRHVLRQRGLHIYDWVCHLPVYYEWDKLFAIYDKYHCDTKSYVVEQLYFNTYYPDVVPFVLDQKTDDIQFRLWNGSSIEDFKKAMKTKIWIANSVKGWQPEMETILQEYYGL